jgi:hypothetical protein
MDNEKYRNMKQYKLIKEYPGSPPKGTVATKKEYGNYEINGGIHILQGFVENYPEFWEKVKNYKIEKICRKNVWPGASPINSKELFTTPYYDTYIKSVERLSDNKVFSVGDIVNDDEKIIELNESENGELRVIVSRICQGEHKSHRELEELYHSATFNRKTEDSKTLVWTGAAYWSIRAGRKVGNTTRQIDLAINQLFAGKKTKVLDHSKNGRDGNENKKLMSKIVKRLKNEHGIREIDYKIENNTIMLSDQKVKR